MGNAVEHVSSTDVDGLFVSRSAWDADRFDIMNQKSIASLEEKKRRKDYVT